MPDVAIEWAKCLQRRSSRQVASFRDLKFRLTPHISQLIIERYSAGLAQWRLSCWDFGLKGII
jgi:hypothetical protein